MPAVLVARDVTVALGEHLVVDRVSLTLPPGACIGVVAPNGTGKATLLRALAGLQPLEAGSVVPAPPTATVGYLPQEPERRAGETVRELLVRRTGVGMVDADLDIATVAMAGGEAEADLRYAAALEHALEGYDGTLVLVTHDRRRQEAVRPSPIRRRCQPRTRLGNSHSS